MKSAVVLALFLSALTAPARAISSQEEFYELLLNTAKDKNSLSVVMPGNPATIFFIFPAKVWTAGRIEWRVPAAKKLVCTAPDVDRARWPVDPPYRYKVMMRQPGAQPLLQDEGQVSDEECHRLKMSPSKDKKK